MERRTILKNLGFSILAFSQLPSWAKSWQPDFSENNYKFLSSESSESLIILIDTIIPGGEIPGAKDLEVGKFIEKMLADCYTPEVRKSVEGFLSEVNNQNLDKKSASEKILLIENWQKSSEKSIREAINLIKNLCIQGYSTSELVMTQYLNYEMAPGHFYGCVTV